MLDEIPGLKIEIDPIFGFKEHVKEIETEYPVKIVIHREISKSFCSDEETIGLVQELYGTKVNKWISRQETKASLSRKEGKHYNVALSHATKKLVRVIYAMEKSGRAYLPTP